MSVIERCVSLKTPSHNWMIQFPATEHRVKRISLMLFSQSKFYRVTLSLIRLTYVNLSYSLRILNLLENYLNNYSTYICRKMVFTLVSDKTQLVYNCNSTRKGKLIEIYILELYYLSIFHGKGNLLYIHIYKCI